MTDFAAMPEELQGFLLDALAVRISYFLGWLDDFDYDDDPDIAEMREANAYLLYLGINLYREWYEIFSDDGQVDLWQDVCAENELRIYPKYYRLGSQHKGGVYQ